jgi:hypothetical protein
MMMMMIMMPTLPNDWSERRAGKATCILHLIYVESSAVPVSLTATILLEDPKEKTRKKKERKPVRILYKVR